MADAATLEAALRRADAAGDTAAATTLAKALQAMRAAPAPAEQQGVGSGILDSLMSGATFGFGDEIQGIEAAVLGRKPGGGLLDIGNYDVPFSERYQRAVDAERGQQAQFAEQNPITAGAANLAGGLATGVGAARAGLTLMGGGGTALQQAGRAGAEGVLYGAATGAGMADGGDRIGGAITAGALGGAVGGVLGGAGALAANAMASRAATAGAPTTQAIRGAADAAYGRARAVNPQFPGFDKYVMALYQKLPDEGFNANLHPQLAEALNRVEELSKLGTAPDLKSLEQLRRLLATPASTFGNPEQQRLAKIAREGLDNFMSQAASAPTAGTAVAVAGQTGAPGAQQALADVQEGRALYSRFKRSEQIDNALYKADLSANASGSGGNIENRQRQVITAILTNPKKVAGYTAAERKAMETVVRGEPVQNIARLVGKLSPSGNGLMAALTGVGGAATAGATMNPIFMAPAAVGMVAKALADRSTGANAAKLSALVRSGGQIPAKQGQAALSPAMQAIIRSLSGQTGALTAP